MCWQDSPGVSQVRVKDREGGAGRAAFPWGRQKKEDRWFEFLNGRRKAYTAGGHPQLRPPTLPAVASDIP